jgi:hypothetical protein
VGGRGRGQVAGGRNDPNNVCTYEYMNKEKKESVNAYLLNSTDVRVRQI